VYTKENIVFYTKFLGEVMVRTGIYCKLPIHHFSKFRGYYKRLIHDKSVSKYAEKRQPAANTAEAISAELRREQEAESILKLAERKDFNPADFLSMLQTRGVEVHTLKSDESELPLELQNRSQGG